LSDLLHEWRYAAADRAATRALLRHAVMRMTHAKLAAGFAGWREAAAARKAKREMLQVCFLGMSVASFWLLFCMMKGGWLHAIDCCYTSPHLNAPIHPATTPTPTSNPK